MNCRKLEAKIEGFFVKSCAMSEMNTSISCAFVGDKHESYSKIQLPSFFFISFKKIINNKLLLSQWNQSEEKPESQLSSCIYFKNYRDCIFLVHLSKQQKTRIGTCKKSSDILGQLRGESIM